MRTSRFFPALVLCAGVAGGAAFLAPAFSQNAQQDISYERSDLSMSQVLVKLSAAGYDNIDKVERERNAYEVKAIGQNGERIRLYVDPQTGDITSTSRKDRTLEQRGSEPGA
ncbi:hypothetical protein GCM10027343_25380 [Noviherbaspirillum agri]